MVVRRLELWLVVCAILAGCQRSPRILSDWRGHWDQSHRGVDLGAELGAPVMAAADGVVSRVETSVKSGITLTIKHARAPARLVRRPGFVWTSYTLLASAVVHPGEQVRRGQVLGTIGVFPASRRVPQLHWRLCNDRACSMTEDPLPVTVGCFDVAKRYPLRLVLTFPVGC